MHSVVFKIALWILETAADILHPVIFSAAIILSFEMSCSGESLCCCFLIHDKLIVCIQSFAGSFFLKLLTLTATVQTGSSHIIVYQISVLWHIGNKFARQYWQKGEDFFISVQQTVHAWNSKKSVSDNKCFNTQVV